MSHQVIEINEENFHQEVIENDSPVLLDIYAEWCNPCKQIQPAVEQLSEEYSGRVKVCKANIEKNSQLAKEYGISALPAFLSFKDGEMINKFIGKRSKDDLQTDIEELCNG